jgi:hypothetical protein
MKKENIKLIKLFEEIINEVGDLNNIPVFEYSLNSNGGTFDFEFKDDKAECRVSFTQMPTEVYHLIDLPPIVPRNKEIISVGFDIEGTDEQYFKSNYRLLLRIIKTVAEIITDSLYRYPKDAVFIIMARDKTGRGSNDSQKMDLYKMVLQQNLPSMYRMGEGSFSTHDLIFFTRK